MILAQVDVILVAHGTEQMVGDDVRDRIDIQGSSKDAIYKEADVMGTVKINQGGVVVDFTPREGSYGKNPGQLPPATVPDPSLEPEFLADLLDQTKAAIMERNERHRAEVARLAVFGTMLKEADGVAGINKLVGEFAGRENAIKERYLIAREAKRRGLVFDKEEKQYRDQQQPAQEAEEANEAPVEEASEAAPGDVAEDPPKDAAKDAGMLPVGEIAKGLNFDPKSAFGQAKKSLGKKK